MRAARGLRFRTRLAIWYLGAFATFFVALEVYSYYELRSILLDSVDASLAAEADRAAEDVDVGSGDLFAQGGDTAQAPMSAAAAAFSFRVVDASGAALGQRNGFPIVGGFPPAGTLPLPGFSTVRVGDHDFRVVTRDIPGTATLGRYYLQAAHSLDAIEAELSSAIRRFVIALPAILLLAALGGLFLATKAMRPIGRLTLVAESVRDDRLALRTRYEGPDDEIGRLARAFDLMLDRLEASFAREKRFTADASHELRTPLAALKGGIEVTLSRPRSAEEYEETLHSMKSAVDRLVSLGSDLLLLARMGSTALVPDAGGVDLRGLLDSCAEVLEEQVEEKRLSMSRNLAEGLVVVGSRDHLARLFMNLLENAVKYAEEGGEVSIASSREGDRAIVRVANTGPGICAGDLAQVFDPFFRGDSARSRRTGGSGLGLAIAREIAEAHRGSLSLSSTEGVETVATVILACLILPDQVGNKRIS